MKFIKFVDLPEHRGSGGFDHAAVHVSSARLYVAHTGNDALDVIDCVESRYLFSINNLIGVAGVLVSEEHGLVFTSNRGEDSVGIFKVGEENHVEKIKVGVRPNGLSFDPGKGILLAANVGNPDISSSFTVTLVDIFFNKVIANLQVPGRTRWTVFDPASGCFFINIADPFQVVVIESNNPTHLRRAMDIPSNGSHGLDFDTATKRLFVHVTRVGYLHWMQCPDAFYRKQI